MENQRNNSQNQEVDLAIISVKIKKYISRVNDSFFDGILFLKRNIIWLLIILVAGGALGYYMDQGEKPYEHKLIVVPNFQSVDYLYETVDLLNKKVQEGDREFLNEVGIDKKIVEIEVEPVVEIYDFIDDEDDRNRIKFEVFRVIAENGKMEETLEDMPTARNYGRHTITITTRGTSTKENVTEPILNYLNSDSYFKEIQTKYKERLNAEIAANKVSIEHIDGVFEGLSNKIEGANKLVYYNNNTELDELVKAKNRLLEKQNENMVNLVNYSDIIKNIGTTINGKKKSLTAGRMKIIIPILFFFLFVGITMFISYYKRQTNKRKQFTA
ncbi:hypothetical protein GCM10007424_16870 [Flavobacterium suaedae]|uniref:Polysaccharide chain length determinant N-terminal domain-containing protein n=1 Tax=Flavobacterium suaedae TaxID=1767027 RepID=A0ABQ1JWJ0_9FLAO|nr:hypothetical protein [Flavobacterium suaedae]GGB77434.1 hypothetical protein GCM10007424_16870 [Flavobacterium suaedae]